VPTAVTTSMNGYTRTVVGTLVEPARDVQQQWVAPEKTPPKVLIDPIDFHGVNPKMAILTPSSGGYAFTDLTTTAQGGRKPVEQGPKRSFP